uniref:Uncharacterized protein n=1 Tax=Sus scrofa TaxID=9823 RepID=A0A8D1LE59_PIG
MNMLNIANRQRNAEKNAMRYNLILVRMSMIKKKKQQQQIANVGEDVEKMESLYTISGNVNWCSHFGKQYGDFSKKQVELPYDPTNSCLAIYPKNKTKPLNQRDICIPLFIAKFFTVAKIWKQPKCPSTDE